jgi:hypothetical protein
MTDEPDVWDDPIVMTKIKSSIIKDLPKPTITRHQITDNIRPESPGSSAIKERARDQTGWGDPDLEAMAMIKDMLKAIDTPSDITKPFAVRKSIYTALNHTVDNPTGYDASLRIKLYSNYEKTSLNVSAKLFNSFMAFLMKPKMIIQGLPTAAPGANEPGFFGRIINRVTGRGQPQPALPAGPQ